METLLDVGSGGAHVSSAYVAKFYTLTDIGAR